LPTEHDDPFIRFLHLIIRAGVKFLAIVNGWRHFAEYSECGFYALRQNQQSSLSGITTNDEDSID
jgi:hypothetical protein